MFNQYWTYDEDIGPTMKIAIIPLSTTCRYSEYKHSSREMSQSFSQRRPPTVETHTSHVVQVILLLGPSRHVPLVHTNASHPRDNTAAVHEKPSTRQYKRRLYFWKITEKERSRIVSLLYFKVFTTQEALTPLYDEHDVLQ